MSIVQTTLRFAEPSNSTEPSVLDNVKTVVDIVGTAVTTAALIAGGIWAYFKFAKGRTFRPRIQADLSGQWQIVDGKHFASAPCDRQEHWGVDGTTG